MFWPGETGRRMLADVLLGDLGQVTLDALGKDYALTIAFTSVCRTVLGCAGVPGALLNFKPYPAGELP
jgi:hypothetical protein